MPSITMSSWIRRDATTQETGRGEGKKWLSQVLQLEQATRYESHKNPDHSEMSFPQQPVSTTVQENSPSSEPQQLCLMVYRYQADFRPTRCTMPTEEAERDHSFLGCRQTQTHPLLHLICKRAPVHLHWLQIPESNSNMILPTAEEKHFFPGLVKCNFKSPVNVTDTTDDDVEKHLQTVCTC